MNQHRQPKVGRNDPCPCGSGRKFKHCCVERRAPAQAGVQPDPWTRSAAPFAAREAAEIHRRERYGDTRPIIHGDFKGHKRVMVGNELHSSKTWKTFADFLIDYIKYALGSSWGENELKKELVDRHPIMKWYDHICRLDQARAQAGQKPDESGIRSVPADGITSAFMVLAYDLYVLRDNGKLQKRVLQRLRRPEHFDGARYEVLVAATFVRAGFDIQFEDETDPSRKHPEFIATHRATKFVVAVEAKARHRSSQAGVTEMKAGVRGLVSTAARKATGHAFALFVDVNLPPGEARRPPAWMPEVQESVVEVVAHEASGQSPFDLVLFSNIPHLHGERGQADPAKHFYFWKPSGAVPSRIPNEVEQAIAKAITQYGRIPEDFPKTE